MLAPDLPLSGWRAGPVLGCKKAQCNAGCLVLTLYDWFNFKLDLKSIFPGKPGNWTIKMVNTRCSCTSFLKLASYSKVTVVLFYIQSLTYQGF